MNAPFRFTPQAVQDLDAIWWFIAEDSRTLRSRGNGNRRDLPAAGEASLIGTKRQDITALPVRFWTLPKFSNYVIVYRPDTAPLQIVAILHGKRDLKKVLERRF